MKYGLAVSGRGSRRIIERMAVKAEEAGYDSLFVTDHFMLPNGNNIPDVWSFLPYLAGRTERIRLGTCVTPITFRPPGMLAKMIATSDNLSNGRITLGAGFGWYRPEFDAFSKWLDSKDRIAYGHEAIEFMIRSWTETRPFDFVGRFINAKGVVVEPKPIQVPYPEILWGGHTPVSLRTAAKFANGWMPIGPRWFGDDFPRPAEYAQMVRIIESELRKKTPNGSKSGNAGGSARDGFTFTSLINMADSATLLREIEEYKAAGMNYFTLGDKADSEDSITNILRVAKDVGESI